MKATKVLRKKPEQESKEQSKEQMVKDAKQSKSSVGAPKRAKVKSIETTKKKAVKKADFAAVPLEWWSRFRQYLREVVHELRKVVFPSRKETIGSTSVVLVLVLLASLFLGFVDLVLSRLVRMLIG
jgi:preprotein translocase subunit SecE